MNNLLVAIAGLICAILLASLTAPYFINWNSFKDELEVFGSEISGQNVKIIGDVELRILPQPVFHTGGLVVKDADDQKIIETNDFTMELDFPSLLKGKIEVTSMLLNDGQIHVSKTKNTRLNLFNFGAKTGQPIGLDDISIDNLMLKNMDVVFTNFVTDNQKSISINQAVIKARSLKGPFRVKGILNVDANDAVLERSFSISTGKYHLDKPLKVKIQVNGEKKQSRLKFSGDLVGLEKQPLLIGEMSIRGVKGENMLGFGSKFGAELADDLQIDSDVSVNYSALNLSKMKLQLGTSNDGDISKFIKVGGELNYNWGLKPRLDGAFNIGVVDYDFIKSAFLSKDQNNQPIYKSLKKLGRIGESWIKQHIVMANKQPDNFNANISINVDQVNFLQNNIIDRVRLMRGLVNISNGKIYLPQFTAQLPGNSKLIYSLSKQSKTANVKQIMGGLIRFESLHMRRFTNWLLFANQQLTNINDFWKLNNRFYLNGNVELLEDGVNIVAQNVKSKGDVYHLNYQYKQNLHQFDLGFDKLSFNAGYLKDFIDYIGPFANRAFRADADRKKIQYHFLPSEILKDIGDVQLNFQSRKTFFDIRDLGVFEAQVRFNPETTILQNISLIGEKVNIKTKGYLPNNFETHSIKNDVQKPAILDFSLVDLEMKFLPNLFADILFEGNFLLSKLIPSNDILNVSGKLELDDENPHLLLLSMAGKIGSSDISMNSELVVTDNIIRQNNIQYELQNIDDISVLKQFGINSIHVTDQYENSENKDAIIRLFISNNPDNISEKEIKLIAIVGNEMFDLSGDITNLNPINLNGKLDFNISQLGRILATTRSYNHNFDQVFGNVDFRGDIVIDGDITRLNSKNVKWFESDFSAFELIYQNDKKLSLIANAKHLNINNVLSFISGNNIQNNASGIGVLDKNSQGILASANAILSDEKNKASSKSFHLKMIESLDLDFDITSERLYLTELLWLEDAKLHVMRLEGEKGVIVKYNGLLGGVKVAGDIKMQPQNGQLDVDITTSAFGVDIEKLANIAGVKQPSLFGQVDIVLDASGRGYSVKGLLANIKGLVDIDFKNVFSKYMDSRQFNLNIQNAVSDNLVETVFADLLNKRQLVPRENSISIRPEKITASVRNGLAIVNQELSFNKNGANQQKGRLVGQMDLTGKNSQFSINIPLANDTNAPKLLLHYERNDDTYNEIIDVENIKEYFKVKLLEKNVKRLEALQIEIKRKNDEEISRYLNEKAEAERFKAEIKIRVEKAIEARKLSEITKAAPKLPLRMPFLFIEGSNGKNAFENSLIGNAASLNRHSLGVGEGRLIPVAKGFENQPTKPEPIGDQLPHIVKNPLQAGNNSPNIDNLVSDILLLKKQNDDLLVVDDIALDLGDEPLDALGGDENSSDESGFEMNLLNNDGGEISSDINANGDKNNLGIGDVMADETGQIRGDIIEIKPIPNLN